MGEERSLPGIGPDGVPFPVHAHVRLDAGRGALIGLAAAAAAGGDAAVVPGALALAERLMKDGLYGPGPVAALACSVPIGLFYADWREMRIAAARTEGSAGGSPGAGLVCVAVNGALAAACWEGARPRRMVLAGLTDGDHAAGGEASPDLGYREDVEAGTRDRLDFDGVSGPRLAWRAAVWHLFHGTAPERALSDLLSTPGATGADAAVLGALLGAAVGEQALPESWIEATRAPAVSRLLDFLRG